MVATTLAVIFALAAAACFALGSLVQQGVARESGQGILRFRLLLALLRQPRWVAGVALSAGSFVIQGAALAFGPLTLVQPLAATDVLFVLPFIARRNRRGLTRRDAAGALTVTAGIVVFLAVSPPSGGTSQPGAAPGQGRHAGDRHPARGGSVAVRAPLAGLTRGPVRHRRGGIRADAFRDRARRQPPGCRGLTGLSPRVAGGRRAGRRSPLPDWPCLRPPGPTAGRC